MAKYTLVPNADHTFHVMIVGNDGARQTLLGFRTRAEAQAWIARDRWQSAAASPWAASRLSALFSSDDA